MLDAGADNAPDYVAYRLVGVRASAPVVHFFGQAQQLAVATDGLRGTPSSLDSGDERGVLSQLGADELVWRNPAALQRKLFVRARELYDDTTVALLKRSA